MATKLSNFIQEIGQGVKPNMFIVDIAFPTEVEGAGGDADMINLLCKSAALPASNLGVIEVPFRGRTVKIAGDRTFDRPMAAIMDPRGHFVENGTVSSGEKLARQDTDIVHCCGHFGGQCTGRFLLFQYCRRSGGQ